jgi:hypothetical protein
MLEESRFAFRVTDGNRNNDVLFFSFDNPDIISSAKKIIKQFYDPRRSTDSAISSLSNVDELEMFSDDGGEFEMEINQDLGEANRFSKEFSTTFHTFR